MALTQRLEIRQGQALVMTPQLQQAIKLLQLSNLELAGFVDQELERNPLLERDESESRPDGERDAPVEAPDPGENLDTVLAREDFSNAEDIDAERCDVYAEDPGPAGVVTDWTKVRNGPAIDGDENALERTLAESETLKDHLLAQLSIAALDPDKRLIAAALIDAIDEAGYLRADIGELGERLGAALPLVEEVLTTIQGFEPTGVGARDLAECLALQLREKNRFDPAMQALISNLELLARRDIAGLKTVCGVDAEDIADMIAEVRALTPKPGLAFGSDPVQPVVPDVFVREGPDGLWLVELNSDTLPRLLVNSRYYTKVAATSSRDKNAKTYIVDCLNNANWLVKSLDQRARTILKVSSEIVRQQDGFLTYGVRHLRPLNLKTIADAIGMHESTVSRVTSNKYIATPRGVFELKYFFTASIQAMNGGESHSAESVRDRIREMIERESSREILSDDRIVSLLTADGVNIARRTVAKYREAMRIPSSVERRRLKQAEPTAGAGV
ncbi:MAG: RNA polymerase factor sigma-54 [Rhizomicrobium sp.]|jgi:RNA polymerase sigma-54 factor